MNKTIGILFLLLLNASCNAQNSETMKDFPITKSNEEWKKELTPEEYRVLREKGTERAFSGEFYKHDENGVYTCAACGNELFDSNTKYESGSGWPSFYDMAKKGCIKFIEDNSLSMKRIEIVCANCGGHLGHVFNDGPNPTGMRYCVNSISLDFKAKE